LSGSQFKPPVLPGVADYDYWKNVGWIFQWTERAVNPNVYPLKYALFCVKSQADMILEAGCGNGRILRYFKEYGYKIMGMDFIEEAVVRLKNIDPELKVERGDITNLHYPDNYFDRILAFGLYHNLQGISLKCAIKETFRVLKSGGSVCVSFRADDIANRINDWCSSLALPHKRFFHKLNLSEIEFRNLFIENKFIVKDFSYVENMPFLYKFRFFRHQLHKEFDENKGRREGYLLSPIW
jgi:SAM-dependent methyltransferase